MVERLASALKSVLDKKSDIDAVVSALERAAPTRSERQESSKSVRICCVDIIVNASSVHLTHLVHADSKYII